MLLMSVCCVIRPMGAHVDEEMKEKIWNNSYMGIWSLVMVDQHTIDRERHIFMEKPTDRKPWVTKTMKNWLQAFAVLGCVMG